MIEVRDVSHSYTRPPHPSPQAGEGRVGGGAWALRGISLAVESGTFVSLLGPSGCGKTTLLRIINGLVHPSLGEVVIDGRRVTGPSADRAMVFQEFNLLPWRTARRNVEMPLEVLGVAAGRRGAISAERLTQVGLQGFADFYPHQLSGGMKQRVGLARALAIDPSYLFMDEPFGALDPQIREMMQIELMKLWDPPPDPLVPARGTPSRKRDGDPVAGTQSSDEKSSIPASAGMSGGGHSPANSQAGTTKRKTVLFVTHSVDEAVFVSDRVIVFGTQPGRVIADLTIELPRPRWANEEELKRSAAFIAYRNDIWHMLKQQLNQSFAGASGG